MARPIGIFGGSFNPAHAGHVYVSTCARVRLGLGQVWWLVSPHNPLKDIQTLADYRTRVRHARALTARHPHIRVLTVEADWRTQYSADTVARLRAAHPQARFVWIMGADNLAGLHRWRHWRRLVSQVPLLVVDRAPYTHAALRSPAAGVMAAARVPVGQLAVADAPAWAFWHLRRHPLSATAIRGAHGGNWPPA